MTYDDITVVAQGPANDPTRLDFIDALPYYKQYFPNIIVSTWTEHLSHELLGPLYATGTILVDKPLADVPKQLRMKYNTGFQILSTLEGLYRVKTPYAMKHRIDERYNNIWKIADKFRANRCAKMVTGSSFLCPKSDGFYFETPDHTMLARTDDLIATFELALGRLYMGKHEKNGEGDAAPEITFTKAYLTIKGKKPDLAFHDTIMDELFDFVNDREMWPFVIRCNTGNMKLTEIRQIDPSLEGISDYKTALNRRGVAW